MPFSVGQQGTSGKPDYGVSSEGPNHPFQPLNIQTCATPGNDVSQIAVLVGQDTDQPHASMTECFVILLELIAIYCGVHKGLDHSLSLRLFATTPFINPTAGSADNDRVRVPDFSGVEHALKG